MAMFQAFFDCRLVEVWGIGNKAVSTVAVAREQTQGKGRLGRVWKAKKDDSITFSFLLRPKIATSEVSSITPLAGLAVCKAIREFTGLDCRIKWPNDIIIGKKKLVGILTEMSAEFDAVRVYSHSFCGNGLSVFGECYISADCCAKACVFL